MKYNFARAHVRSAMYGVRLSADDVPCAKPSRMGRVWLRQNMHMRMHTNPKPCQTRQNERAGGARTNLLLRTKTLVWPTARAHQTRLCTFARALNPYMASRPHGPVDLYTCGLVDLCQCREKRLAACGGHATSEGEGNSGLCAAMDRHVRRPRPSIRCFADRRRPTTGPAHRARGSPVEGR